MWCILVNKHNFKQKKVTEPKLLNSSVFTFDCFPEFYVFNIFLLLEPWAIRVVLQTTCCLYTITLFPHMVQMAFNILAKESLASKV